MFDFPFTDDLHPLIIEIFGLFTLAAAGRGRARGGHHQRADRGHPHAGELPADRSADIVGGEDLRGAARELDRGPTDGIIGPLNPAPASAPTCLFLCSVIGTRGGGGRAPPRPSSRQRCYPERQLSCERGRHGHHRAPQRGGRQHDSHGRRDRSDAVRTDTPAAAPQAAAKREIAFSLITSIADSGTRDGVAAPATCQTRPPPTVDQLGAGPDQGRRQRNRRRVGVGHPGRRHQPNSRDVRSHLARWSWAIRNFKARSCGHRSTWARSRVTLVPGEITQDDDFHDGVLAQASTGAGLDPAH